MASFIIIILSMWAERPIEMHLHSIYFVVDVAAAALSLSLSIPPSIVCTHVYGLNRALNHFAFVYEINS